MKRVALIQSSYIPWRGFFDIIHDVDLFIFYDDVQYTKNDWRSRNKIKTANGSIWLTVPAGSDLNRLIYEVRLADNSWSAKHWKSIRQSYARAPYFNQYKAFFEHVYLGTRWDSLSELNQFLTKTIATEFLGVKTEFADSRAFQAEGRKLDRLLDVLGKAGAQSYVSGPSAKGYIDETAFQQRGVELMWKSYDGYPEYRQLYPPFEPAVSIIDLLFNVGPDAPHYIWGWRESA